eukprot:COSAG01_NODE_766_length_13741_cov_16.630479_13_plen_139_part_00
MNFCSNFLVSFFLLQLRCQFDLEDAVALVIGGFGRDVKRNRDAATHALHSAIFCGGAASRFVPFGAGRPMAVHSRSVFPVFLAASGCAHFYTPRPIANFRLHCQLLVLNPVLTAVNRVLIKEDWLLLLKWVITVVQSA